MSHQKSLASVAEKTEESPQPFSSTNYKEAEATAGRNDNHSRRETGTLPEAEMMLLHGNWPRLVADSPPVLFVGCGPIEMNQDNEGVVSYQNPVPALDDGKQRHKLITGINHSSIGPPVNNQAELQTEMIMLVSSFGAKVFCKKVVL